MVGVAPPKIQGGVKMVIKKYQNRRYGRLVVDFEKGEIIIDSLKRERIWEDANKNYSEQSYIYSEIIDELLGDDAKVIAPPRPGREELWAGEPTDFGFRAILEDGSIFQVDAEGSYFFEG